MSQNMTICLFSIGLGHFLGSMGSHMTFIGLEKGSYWMVFMPLVLLQLCFINNQTNTALISDLSGHMAIFNIIGQFFWLLWIPLEFFGRVKCPYWLVYMSLVVLQPCFTDKESNRALMDDLSEYMVILAYCGNFLGS